MDIDISRPFRGSQAVRESDLTWGVLTGPAFRRVGPDVYVVAGTPDSPLLRVRALLVRGGRDAVATGWSACVVLGLDVASGPTVHEIAAPGRRLHPAPGCRIGREHVPLPEITEVGGAATTTTLRTAFDLARRSGPKTRAIDQVIAPLTDAVVACDALARLGRFGPDDLTTFAEHHPGLRGIRHVDRVAALLDASSGSPPETRARVVLVLAGLPRPVLQFEVDRGPALWPWRLDLAWPEFKVAVEYDGHDHAKADRRGRDLDRLDALREQGWIVIVITAVQLARPRWLIDRVRRALLERGWTGALATRGGTS